MSTASVMNEPATLGWRCRLATIRRIAKVEPEEMAGRMGCSLAYLHRLEGSQKTLKLSAMWSYAIALRVSPDMLIEDGTLLLFGPDGNSKWLRELRQNVLAYPWPTTEETVKLTLKSLVDETFFVEKIDRAGFNDSAMASLDARNYDGPLHHLAEVFAAEEVTVRTLARHLGTTEPEILRRIRPSEDMRVDELERFAFEAGVPTQVLFRGIEFSDNGLVLRRAMLKLAKYFAHLKEIVSGSAEASADAFLRHVAQAAELRSEDVSPFPLTGQRRSPKDVSPLEERSISQLYYERGDE